MDSIDKFDSGNSVVRDVWETQPLGKLCDEYGGIIQTGPFGSQLHQQDYVQEGTPVVMPKDIVGDRISTQDIARISSKDVERLKKHKLKVGDVVLPRRGEINKSALIGNKEHGFLCGTGCLKITPPTTLDSVFFSLFLRTQHVGAWLEGNAVGATMLNLSGAIVRKLPVPILPLTTQQKIAHILSAYDDLVENNLQRIKLLEEMAQITYEQWFVRMKFPEHETTPIDAETGLPEGWEKTTCFEAMDVLSGERQKPVSKNIGMEKSNSLHLKMHLTVFTLKAPKKRLQSLAWTNVTQNFIQRILYSSLPEEPLAN